jgi:predicted metal-dependent phosphoesterase TrpH
MKFVDLHLHTRFSDGEWTPANLVLQGKRTGLAAMALTDHDTVEGVPEFLEAARRENVPALAGVEITCRLDDTELHMLGYFYGDPTQHRSLVNVLREAEAIRARRIEQMVRKLNETGIGITLEDVRSCSDCGTLGRPHVAQALVNAKVVRTLDEAFERFLRRGKPGFVDRQRMTTAEAIELVRESGGVAVLAHPGLNKVDDRIPELARQGMVGLEAWHSRHSAAQAEHYRAMAAQLGLIVTGGSDSHAPGRYPQPGEVQVPEEAYRNLERKLLQTVSK